MDHPTPQDLSKVELFAGLNDDQLAELAAQFEIEEHPAGHRLVTEGRSGYAFYVLAKGHAEVTHAGEQLRVLGPDDFFGEIAILGEGRRTATVTATEPVVVWTLFGTVFRVMQRDSPELAETLEAAMQERLARG